MFRQRATCTHIPNEQGTPRAEACESCGSRFSLRVCATCGHVGCCESQAGHARAHALGERHPVIRQVPLDGRSFTWCYECRRYV